MRTLRSITQLTLRINLKIAVHFAKEACAMRIPTSSRVRFSGIKQREKTGENRLEHHSGQFPRIGIQARAMIAVDQELSIRQGMKRAMCETKMGAAHA
jgi:hypothetical protein